MFFTFFKIMRSFCFSRISLNPITCCLFPELESGGCPSCLSGVGVPKMSGVGMSKMSGVGVSKVSGVRVFRVAWCIFSTVSRFCSPSGAGFKGCPGTHIVSNKGSL